MKEFFSFFGNVIISFFRLVFFIITLPLRLMGL